MECARHNISDDDDDDVGCGGTCSYLFHYLCYLLL